MLFPSIFDDMAFDKDSKLMKTDVISGENETKLLIDVPGVKKEDIDIDLRNGYLSVSCNTHEEKDEEHEGEYIYRERSSRSCSRTFDVGMEVTNEDIEAQLTDGVLQIKVKHTLKPEPETKKIEIY